MPVLTTSQRRAWLLFPLGPAGVAGLRCMTRVVKGYQGGRFWRWHAWLSTPRRPGHTADPFVM